MLALRVAVTAPHVTMVDTADPDPLPHEVLVRVRAFSLNRGEVVDLRTQLEGPPSVGTSQVWSSVRQRMAVALRPARA